MSTQADFLVARIEDLIRKRSLTDRRMGNVWMIVPILPILVAIALIILFFQVMISSLLSLGNVQATQSAAASAVVGVFAIYALGIFSLYVILLIGAFALYYLIDRRNAHFKRQHQLFAAIAKYLSSKSNVTSAPNVAKLSQTAEDSMFEEQDRPAGLWAVLYLFVSPIIGIIVAYNLTQDLRRHDEQQAAFQKTVSNAFSEAGIKSPGLVPYNPNERDPVLFLILTLITGGLFWIYWFYTLLKDYNEHFASQVHIEDSILAALKPAPLVTACASCGGAVPENAKFCPFCGTPQIR